MLDEQMEFGFTSGEFYVYWASQTLQNMKEIFHHTKCVFLPSSYRES